jgi:hypothetical protein
MRIAIAALSLISLLSTSCASGWAITNKGFAAHLSIFDLRRKIVSAEASDAKVGVEKQAISEEFAEALPDIVQMAVRAALACAGLTSAAEAAKFGAACLIPESSDPGTEAPGPPGRP